MDNILSHKNTKVGFIRIHQTQLKIENYVEMNRKGLLKNPYTGDQITLSHQVKEWIKETTCNWYLISNFYNLSR